MGARDNLGGPWEEAARTDRPPRTARSPGGEPENAQCLDLNA